MHRSNRIAVQVPIKHRSSERIRNKNFHELRGKPLCFWVLDELVRCCPSGWDLFVDSENAEVFARLSTSHQERFVFHRRPEWFAGNEANGNHLLQQFAIQRSDYDLYCQVYVTAVLLRGEVVVSAVSALESSPPHDSVLLVNEETGFIWFDGRAVNYDPTRPAGLKRSQDVTYLKETTGLYCVRRDVALRMGCRIGTSPLFFVVPKLQALDIDTLEDLDVAGRLLDAR